MKYLLPILFIAGFHAAALSQTVTVLDQSGKQPLEIVRVSSAGSGVSVLTDSSGRADISAMRGAEKISFQLIGYQHAHHSFAALERAGFIAYLTVSDIELDQVVVAATRWRQNKREIPAKITSITPAEIALQNPQTAADMLGASGEIFIQKSQQGGGSPMIRGFSANRLLYAVDGVRMNSAIFRSGNLQNVISLDPFAVERAEVIFGPGSIIYGSDAIGAVMSFQTLQAQTSGTDSLRFKGSAVARTASASQERTGHFDLNVGWKKWAILSSFTSTDYGDLRMGRHGPDDYLRPFYVQRQDGRDVVIANPDPLVQTPTGYGQINMMQKIRFQPNKDWDFQYGFHYSTTTDYDRYDRLLRLRNGAPRSAEWRYGPQVWRMNNLNISHSSPTRWYDQMSLRLAEQFFEESRMDRDLNGPTRFVRLEKINAWSANLDFLKTAGERHKFFYGAEVVRNQVVSSGTDENVLTGARAPGASRYPQADWSSYAAYLSYQYRLADQWLLQTGARYNQFLLDADFSRNLPFFPLPFEQARLNKGALTGSLGLIFDPAENWTISLNGSTGFRAPNVDDLGKVFDSEPGAVVVPNANLRAEYAYNLEADIARVFGERLKIDLAAYYTLLDQALVRRDFQLNGQDSILYNGEPSRVQAVQNAASATVYGLQAGVELKLPGGFRFSSQFNYQKGEEVLDNGETSPLRHAAPWFGISRLSYSTARLNLQIYATYSGAMPFDRLPQESKASAFLFAADADGNPYAPAWHTFNFKALYQINAHFSVSGGVENITDQRYRPFSSGLAGAGRNVLLALRAQF
jgi:hemoglobin/transferrin/lactoferrin receptor protein